MLLQIKYRIFKNIVVNVCSNLQISFAQSVGKYDVIINEKVKLQKLSKILEIENFLARPVGRAVTDSSVEREVWGSEFFVSNLGPVKLDTMLPTTRHRCDLSSKKAVLPMGALTRKWDPSYMLQHITAGLLKDLI